MPDETLEPHNGPSIAPTFRKMAKQVRLMWGPLMAASSAVAHRSERLLTSAFRVTTKLLTATLSGAILIIFLKALLGADTVYLRSIEVPSTLSDTGLTSKVVTWKLRDALNANRKRVASQILPTSLLVMQEIPDVSIPETALSIDRAVGLARSLLPAVWRHDEIYGEFSLVGRRLSLELRINERVVFASSTPFSPADDDAREVQHLISTAAFALTVQRYTAAIRRNPTSAPLRIALGYLWWDHARRDNAVDSFNEALLLDPSRPHAYAALGDIARKQLNLDEAHRRFREALERDPKHADAYTGLGYTYLREEDFGRAEQAFNQSRLLSGGGADSHVGLAHTYWRMGNLDRAVAELRDAIRVSPDAPDPYILLGAARRTQDRLEDAIAAYEFAALLNPLSFEPHLGLGGARLAQNRADEAIAEFREAVRLYREAFVLACDEIAARAVAAPNGADYPALQRRLEARVGGTAKCPPISTE